MKSVLPLFLLIFPLSAFTFEIKYVSSRNGIIAYSLPDIKSNIVARITFGSMVLLTTNKNYSKKNRYWRTVMLQNKRILGEKNFVYGWIQNKDICRAKGMFLFPNWHIGEYISKSTWMGSEWVEYLQIVNNNKFLHWLSVDGEKPRVISGTYQLRGMKIFLYYKKIVRKYKIGINEMGIIFLSSLEPYNLVGVNSRTLLKGSYDLSSYLSNFKNR